MQGHPGQFISFFVLKYYFSPILQNKNLLLPVYKHAIYFLFN